MVPGDTGCPQRGARGTGTALHAAAVAAARLLAALLLAGAALGSTGCFLLLGHAVSLHRAYLLTNPSDKKSPRNRFLEWRGKKKPGSGPTVGVAVTPVFLRPPFELAVRVGVFDPARLPASEGASGCVQVDEEGSLAGAGDFFYICMLLQDSPAVGAMVSTNVDGNTMFYPGVEAGVIRISADSTKLSFEFQPDGGSGFDLITTQAFADPSVAWYASFGATLLYKGGVMDVDDVEWTSTPAVSPTPEEALGESIDDALRDLSGARTDLDGAAPDASGATGRIQSAETHAAAAQTQLGALSDAKLAKKVGRKIDCLDASATQALAKIAQTKLDPAIRKIEKGMRCGGEGLARLRGFDVVF
jgi:hypothetical protein